MKEPLALLGGAKTMEKEFPWPVFDHDEIDAVMELLKKGQWGDPDCSGPIRQFENEFARYCGTQHACAVANGSIAIRIALLAMGVKPGDEVIVPPYTFYATASTVVEANCVPVFADIHPDTYCIDPESVKERITERTRVIIPVHFGGQPCDMDVLEAIAKKHGLRIIEDAAHAHGSEYKNKKCGSIGDAATFSFQSSKNMTSGEGGVITTDDEELFDMIDSLRNCGRAKGHAWYEHFHLGCNNRITTLQVAILRAQLKRVEEQTRKRNENGLYLNSLLERIDGIQPLRRGTGETLHSYHLYLFKYDKSAFHNVSKKRFVQLLAAEGVPCAAGYPIPLYKQPVFLNKSYFTYYRPDHIDYAETRCPVAERACAEEAVWIMQNALLGDKDDMEKIAHAIRKIQNSDATE